MDKEPPPIGASQKEREGTGETFRGNQQPAALVIRATQPGPFTEPPQAGPKSFVHFGQRATSHVHEPKREREPGNVSRKSILAGFTLLLAGFTLQNPANPANLEGSQTKPKQKEVRPHTQQSNRAGKKKKPLFLVCSKRISFVFLSP